MLKGGRGISEEGLLKPELLPECGQEIYENLGKHLATLNEDEKALFIRELLKELVDTECSDLLLNIMPEGTIENMLNRLD